MKNSIQSILLLVSLVSGCFITCKNKKAEVPTTEKSQEKVQEDAIDPKLETKNKIVATYKTLLRPEQEVECGKEYIDTIYFIDFDDNLDYWYFLARKNKDTIAITYYDDTSIRKLTKGDELIIQWKLKELENAGDPELSEIRPFLVSYKQIQSKKGTDKKDLKSKEKTNNSFVISCGSGCALTYSEYKTEKNDSGTEVTFSVEAYINEKLSDQYLETYIFNCKASGEALIRLKENTQNAEQQHPEILEKLKLYGTRLCNS